MPLPMENQIPICGKYLISTESSYLVLTDTHERVMIFENNQLKIMVVIEVKKADLCFEQGANFSILRLGEYEDFKLEILENVKEMIPVACVTGQRTIASLATWVLPISTDYKYLVLQCSGVLRHGESVACNFESVKDTVYRIPVRNLTNFYFENLTMLSVNMYYRLEY